MSNKKILFRADAAPHIGIGDLMSFIHLSRNFSNEWEIFFIVKDYKATTGLIKKYNLKNIYLLDNAISIKDEIDYINYFIKKNNIFSFFLQTNENKLGVYNDINVEFRACVHFDSDLPLNCDLVLSWNYDSKDYFDIEKYKNTKLFVGAEYVALPLNFNFKEIEKRVYKEKRKNLLVSMGGADEKNLTLDVVKNIYRLNLNLNMTIILGSGYEFDTKLLSYLNNTKLTYIIKKSVDDMYSEYMNCDLAIGTGGLTVSELVATRTPSLIVSAYEHQIERCDYFDKKGLIKHLGYMNTSFDNEDFDFLPNSKNKFSSKVFEVVDYFDEIFK